jgi:hypothetical protein
MAGTHAKKSPSGAERFHACSGALALIAQLPDAQRSSAGRAAQLGTAAHALLEQCLTDREPPSVHLGRIIELVGENEDAEFLRKGSKLPAKKSGRIAFKVDQDMVENVGMAYDYCVNLLSQTYAAKIHLESKTNPLPDRKDTSGTADVTIDDWPYCLHVLDYKNGRMLVDHNDNEQLLAYLLGRAHDFGWDYMEYKITVMQPNAWHEDGFIRTFTVTAEGLKAFEAKHRAACERADEAQDALDEVIQGLGETELWAETYLKTGPHCLMCNAMAICPAYRKMLEEEARLAFAEDPTETLSFAINDSSRALAVIKWAPYMQALIKACNSYVYHSLVAGDKVPGLKLKRGRSVRVWKDDMTPAQIEKALVEEGYLSANEIARLWSEPTLILGTQAEKLVPAKKRKDFSRAFLDKPEGRLVVTTEDDPAPGVTVNPLDDFEPLDLGED